MLNGNSLRHHVPGLRLDLQWAQYEIFWLKSRLSTQNTGNLTLRCVSVTSSAHRKVERTAMVIMRSLCYLTESWKVCGVFDSSMEGLTGLVMQSSVD